MIRFFRISKDLWHRLYLGGIAFTIIAFSAVFLLALPPRYSPVGPVSLDDSLGPFSSKKLAALRDNPAACARAIGLSKLKVETLPEKHEGGFCSLSHAVLVKQSFYPYSQELRISCPLASALYVWERSVVAPAAAKHLDSAVVEIEMFGAYSCRRIYGQKEGKVSEHASGNAIDVSGFKLANGKVILVDKKWRENSPESDFLHEVRDRGCGVFQTVLSPDYNAAHHNHLHFDMGDYKFCR